MRFLSESPSFGSAFSCPDKGGEARKSPVYMYRNFHSEKNFMGNGMKNILENRELGRLQSAKLLLRRGRHNSGQTDFVTVNYRAKPNLNWKGFLC